MLPVALLSVTAILLVLDQLATFVPFVPQVATVRAPGGRAASRPPADLLSNLHLASGRTAASSGRPTSRRGAPAGYRDPLRHHRAVVGPDARTPWYIRVRALLSLVLMIVAIGAAFAGFTLLVIASGRFLLEILAG